MTTVIFTSAVTWAKILGLTVLLFALMSINFAGLGLSSSLSSSVALILAAFMDTLVLSYLAMSSRFTGLKEWTVVFSLLYVGNYVLTAMESLYLTSLLTASIVFGLLANGALVFGIFAFTAVELFGGKPGKEKVVPARLAMPVKEWVWKIAASGAVYLLLFIIIGVAVYAPLAKALDPTAYATEQASIPASTAGLVFPLEYLRGIIWTALAVIATVSLSFSWRKTSLLVGLLLAVPVSMSIFLSSSIAPGLQVAHFVELFVENFLFGIFAVWMLHLHSRIVALTTSELAKASSTITTTPPSKHRDRALGN